MDARPDALAERVEALERQVTALTELLAEAAAARPPVSSVPGPERAPKPDGERVSRRGLLTAAAGAAVGSAVAVVANAAPAAAANGDNFILGSASNTASIPTGLATSASGYGIGCTQGLNALPAGVSGALFGHTKSAALRAGVVGYAEGADGEVAVLGVSDSSRAMDAWTKAPGTEPALFAYAGPGVGFPTGTALEGHGLIGLRVWGGADGTGVVAAVGDLDTRPARNARTAVDAEGRGADSIGVRAQGGRAQLLLVPQGGAPAARTDPHVMGEIVETAGGALWLCTASGTPGTWRKLAGPTTAGALHVLASPVRAYDSRTGQQPTTVVKGKLTSPAARDVDLAVGGGVASGATAALVNLTVVGTSSSGFLAAYQKGAAVPASSSINWDHTSSVVANNATVGVDSARRITVKCGAGNTHFIVDVLGYYL